ncbi:hypothetical protein WJX82_004200 [Trebouxia sp. C0006]
MLLSSSSCSRLLPFALLSVLLTSVAPSQTLIPAFPEGCPYIAENCTQLELLPVQRTDSCHQSIAAGFAQEIAAADDAQGVDLVFYGDRITKQWREVQPQVNGTPEVFTTYFGQYAAAILGVGEDQTSILLWRQQHGEVFLKHPPQVSILLIGTNDLGAAASCNVGEPGATTAANGTASRIEDIVTYLQQVNPHTTIILMGILPWGLVDQGGTYVWPNEYTQGILTVNSLIQELAAGLSNVHYIDCGHQLFPTGQLLDSVAPDGLHPNSEGMGRLAACITPLSRLKRLIVTYPRTANICPVQAAHQIQLALKGSSRNQGYPPLRLRPQSLQACSMSVWMPLMVLINKKCQGQVEVSVLKTSGPLMMRPLRL